MPLRLVRYAKRSPHWYLRGSIRGQGVFETTGTDERERAEEIRAKREVELLERSVFGAGTTVTFPEAASSYIDAGGEKRFLGAYDETAKKWTLLIGHFETTKICNIGQMEADEAAKALLPKAGHATRKRHVYGPLKAVLNHADKKGWGRAAKIDSPKVQPVTHKWATPEWFNALLPHCAPRVRRFVLIAAYTGRRLSEVLRLDWDADIDLNQRTIVFRRTKNKKMKTVHIPDTLLVELATVPEAERRGLLFPWSDKNNIHKRLRTACAAAKIPYLSPHQLGRHTFATWLRIYAKRDLRGVMEDGGWDSIASVARYSHVTPGESVDAVNLLPAVQNVCSANVKPIKDRRIRKKSA